MASSLSCTKSRSLIDEFSSFTIRIALELVKDDIEIAKFLINENIPEETLTEIQKGVQLVSCLKHYRLLSENNLDFFIELLEKSRRVDLANRVKEYQKTSVNTVKDAPQAQIEEKIPAPNMESLSLVMPGQPTTITVALLDEIRAAICNAIGLRQSELFYVATEAKNGNNPCCSQLSLQLPEREEKLLKLQMDALNKKSWLMDLNVFELKVDNKAAIKING